MKEFDVWEVDVEDKDEITWLDDIELILLGLAGLGVCCVLGWI